MFDTRTHTIGARPDVPVKRSAKETSYSQVCDRVKKEEISGLFDDINGISQDKCHRNNHNGCIGCSSSQDPLLGNPRGNKSVLD